MLPPEPDNRRKTSLASSVLSLAGLSPKTDEKKRTFVDDTTNTHISESTAEEATNLLRHVATGSDHPEPRRDKSLQLGDVIIAGFRGFRGSQFHGTR